MTDIRSQLEVTWLETIGGGFPPGSAGATMQATARAAFETGVGIPEPEVIDRHGAWTVNTVQVDAAIGFAEFLAGSAMTDGETDDLRKAILADFANNPAQATAAFEQVLRAIVQIPGMDPERRAMERHAAQANITVAERQAGLSTPTSQMIERYNPVLHVDRAGGLVMTADGLEAYWSLYDMIATIVGLPISGPDDHVALSALLPEAYESWVPRVRSEMTHARGRWVALRAAVRSMDDETYETFRSGLADQVDSADGIVAAVTGFGMAAGAAAQARRISRRLRTPATP